MFKSKIHYLSITILLLTVFPLSTNFFNIFEHSNYFPMSFYLAEEPEQTTTSEPVNGADSDDLCLLTDPDCGDVPIRTDQVLIPDSTRLSKAKVILILFWMQDCAHCAEVLTQVLPALQEKYQDQVVVYPIELKELNSIDLFYQMAERLGVKKNNIGVPLMIIGDRVLTGDQINAELNQQISRYLQQESYSLLAIPEFEDHLPEIIKTMQLDQIVHSPETSTLYRSQKISSRVLWAGIPVVFIGFLIFFIIKKKQLKT